MSKRSMRPKWIKGSNKPSTYNPKKPSDLQPMTFKKAKARKPRQNNT